MKKNYSNAMKKNLKYAKLFFVFYFIFIIFGLIFHYFGIKIISYGLFAVSILLVFLGILLYLHRVWLVIVGDDIEENDKK